MSTDDRDDVTPTLATFDEDDRRRGTRADAGRRRRRRADRGDVATSWRSTPIETWDEEIVAEVPPTSPMPSSGRSPRSSASPASARRPPILQPRSSTSRTHRVRRPAFSGFAPPTLDMSAEAIYARMAAETRGRRRSGRRSIGHRSPRPTSTDAPDGGRPSEPSPVDARRRSRVDDVTGGRRLERAQLGAPSSDRQPAPQGPLTASAVAQRRLNGGRGRTRGAVRPTRRPTSPERTSTRWFNRSPSSSSYTLRDRSGLRIGGAVDELAEPGVDHRAGTHRTRLERDVHRALVESPLAEMGGCVRSASTSACATGSLAQLAFVVSRGDHRTVGGRRPRRRGRRRGRARHGPRRARSGHRVDIGAIELIVGAGRRHGGGSGIRTHGRLPFTRFPSVPIRPLSHPSRDSDRP